jgi:alpha-amylase/alpha-mannosidase (GH57 family)
VTTRIALHGHAYQPPRDDPWSGRLPVEESASPFRDWNERITAECYAPCTATRLHDADGRITAIVNLFERISFDLGPTLGRWLERHAPEVHRRIVAGDRVGRTAIAHPYHHIILPLANERDALTEMKWGLADFRGRFGREADGMWLPETAIDARTYAQLGALGLRFTIVAPHQVARMPAPGAVGRAGDAGPMLVVYDGAASHALAFGEALASAEHLAERLSSVSAAGLVTAATDLETFGHHHRFTERAIGHAMFEVAPARGLSVGGLMGLLDDAPIEDVEGIIASAWSCAHGHGRWHTECGCSTDGAADSHQRWRGPLRRCLEVLADHAREVFERRGAEVFEDPYAARDAYGDVLADPGRWDEFVERYVRAVASTDEARMLLASQEATLASFTSCAWFFADLLRPETGIVLREAARSSSLLEALGEVAPLSAALASFDEPGVLDAPAGKPRLLEGRDVWEWSRAERDADGRDDHGLLRWDSMSAVASLVADLARRAVAGSDESAAQAVSVVELVRRAGEHSDLTVAQEIVHDAIIGIGRAVPSGVAALGEALGLAVDVISGRSARRVRVDA